MPDSIDRNFKSEGEIVTKELDVRDEGGVARFQVKMRYRAEGSAGKVVLESLVLRGDAGSVDIFELMRVHPNIRIYLSDDMPPVHSSKRNEARIVAPWPSTPMRILILLHELSHMQQHIDWKGHDDIHVNAGISQSLVTLLALEAYGLKVVDADKFRDLLLNIHDRLLSLLEATGDDLINPLKEITSEYETLRESYPVISKLMELYEPLIEQDAHARTNTMLDLIGKQIGTDMNFVADQEPHFLAQVNPTDEPMKSAYAVLKQRKLTSFQPSGSTVMAMCENLNIPLAPAEETPATELLKSKSMQDALKEVRAKMGSIKL